MTRSVKDQRVIYSHGINFIEIFNEFREFCHIHIQ